MESGRQLTSPLVSCIVPIYNPGIHLREALASIVVQRHRPIELILIDDGSTDDAGPLIEASLADVDAGVGVRRMRRENGGPAAARNTGIAHARGAFVAFLDQDDRWHHDKLARQIAHLSAHPEVDVSVAHVESWWEGPTDGAHAARQPDQPRSGVVPGYLTSTMVARRDVFDRVGGFDTDYRYADSLDWFARAAEQGVRVELLPDILLFHRVHATNLSRRGEASRAESARILKRALDRRRRVTAASA